MKDIPEGTPAENDARLQAAVEACCKAGADLVYLHGSHAKDKVREDSDIHLAVFLGSGAPRERFGAVRAQLIGNLMSVFESNNVHVVILNDAPTNLAYEGVIQAGRLLFESDPLARVQFEVRAFQEYLAQRHCEGCKSGT